MINTIIIDDEVNSILSLQQDITMFCPEIAIVDTCSNGTEGILAIKRHQPDLIFLDLEMPLMNGFDMLEAIGPSDFNIIFTTAYDQFAVKAFRVNALDYLLKPIDSHDLIDAVAKVKARQSKTPHITNFLEQLKQLSSPQKIPVPTRDGYELIAPEQIIYCKADGAYTHVFLENNRKLILSKSLGEATQLLPAGLFERIHHSFIVNLQHIVQFRKTDGTFIIMDNGDELSVSKSKREQLLLKLGIKKHY